MRHSFATEIFVIFAFVRASADNPANGPTSSVAPWSRDRLECPDAASKRVIQSARQRDVAEERAGDRVQRGDRARARVVSSAKIASPGTPSRLIVSV